MYISAAVAAVAVTLVIAALSRWLNATGAFKCTVAVPPPPVFEFHESINTILRISDSS